MKETPTKLSAAARNGLISAFGCYALWGLLPVYWKWLSHVSYFELVGHRILWCFVFLFILARFVQKADLKQYLKDPRSLGILAGCSAMITATWCLYIFGVTSGRIVEVALGYYVTPLTIILCSVLFFKETLTLVQKIATGLATIGVIYLAVDYGSFPWLALALAVLFGIYSSLKKLGGYPVVAGLTIESMLALPLALAFIIVSFFLPNREFLAPSGGTTTLLLVLGGVVTAIPFLLFAKAANTAPLSLIGFIQYVEPTITLALGVVLYGEPFTSSHLVCFSLIWLGLILVTVEVLWSLRARNARNSAG
ncbi:MAG: EamA family transporter RarD [Coriobacteriales bacterium]|jgi:chloramphenicol-sensitive protein RarD|nr:EamA family transporter RarD [Coriobacteriales bacterium]